MVCASAALAVSISAVALVFNLSYGLGVAPLDISE
jgi:hypothetical protein